MVGEQVPTQMFPKLKIHKSSTPPRYYAMEIPSKIKIEKYFLDLFVGDLQKFMPTKLSYPLYCKLLITIMKTSPLKKISGCSISDTTE